MILTIVGWFWIVCGAIFLIWPNFFKKILAKKSIKKIRRTILFLLLPLFFWLAALIFKVQGIFFKFLVIVAIILLIKGLFYLLSKASDKIKNFIQRKSVAIFRGFALIYICLGVFFVVFAA